MSDLQTRIDSLTSQDAPDDAEARAAVSDLLAALEAGEVRSASRGEDGVWRANGWVKRGILLGFRVGQIEDQSMGPFAFFDKDTYPTRPFSADAGVRIVPGGSTVRRGSYLAPGVVCMPPMYVNVGAYVDGGTMVDSHALVGSCAQIGRDVHLSAAAQVGGVLEPIGAAPVVIEDGVFVGGGCGVYEGTVVRENAVLAAGVILTRSSRVYDLVNETVLRSSADAPLEIPAGAVVVPGSRAVDSEFGRANGLALAAPMIVKYRDASTDASTTLEDALR
ncbi:MAG TPA: 2,3,4,5-tetrahydropyridine-2,6-dicarboxylate N-succinyltransferase [Bacteroidetes bacterium]|nr:2,3,4,5-tetrahydropyridine-2,6-dicarboxylate N-succinyltransferase [Bacteroidota bacterium]HIL57554.1 2,3,4,5-tetrahydropyridine-2,6-dicarboxylate N-succinyltransferase [Rhodothermales bacterium]